MRSCFVVRTGKDYKISTIRKGTKGNCVKMVDIGYYNSCPHMCAYCYANYSEKEVKTNYLKHDKTSSLLIGEITEKDTIKRRYKKEMILQLFPILYFWWKSNFRQFLKDIIYDLQKK